MDLDRLPGRCRDLAEELACGGERAAERRGDQDAGAELDCALGHGAVHAHDRTPVLASDPLGATPDRRARTDDEVGDGVQYAEQDLANPALELRRDPVRAGFVQEACSDDMANGDGGAGCRDESVEGATCDSAVCRKASVFSMSPR